MSPQLHSWIVISSVTLRDGIEPSDFYGWFVCGLTPPGCECGGEVALGWLGFKQRVVCLRVSGGLGMWNSSYGGVRRRWEGPEPRKGRDLETQRDGKEKKRDYDNFRGGCVGGKSEGF
eukprot:GHVT01084563.1.p1 GENE.GHVT01084563.1~~GHVT01084563.1.p1  ORF type:complete len:118 (+),score=4.64 GHVT01084563.1:324-677(+)